MNRTSAAWNRGIHGVPYHARSKLRQQSGSGAQGTRRQNGWCATRPNRLHARRQQEWNAGARRVRHGSALVETERENRLEIEYLNWHIGWLIDYSDLCAPLTIIFRASLKCMERIKKIAEFIIGFGFYCSFIFVIVLSYCWNLSRRRFFLFGSFEHLSNLLCPTWKAVSSGHLRALWLSRRSQRQTRLMNYCLHDIDCLLFCFISRQELF